MKRKIIQIVKNTEQNYNGTVYSFITALCDDGSVFSLNPLTEKWNKLTDVPQDEEIKEGETK